MKRFLFILGLSVILVFVLFVVQRDGKLSRTNKLSIVTTIGQITDAARYIAGDHAQVVGLMGAGVDPHLFRASESDVQKLASADIVFYNGLFLEAKMEEIFEKMKRNRVVVAVGDGIPKEKLLDSETYVGHYDPHIWFDVSVWKMAAQRIGLTLAEVDPDNRDYYQIRMQEYLKHLDVLNAYVEKRAKELPSEQRVLVTAHDAFRYFGRTYGFEVVGLQGISTDSQAGTADVIRLAEFITKRKIRAIFVESSVPERNIKAVVEAVKSRGWDVKVGGELFSDAMGDEGTLEGTYDGMVRHNIDTIVNGLKE